MARRIPHPTTVDTETFGIEGRPHYPPAPVGVSIKKWGKKPKYYAWGHVNGVNTHTKEQAIAALLEAYATPDGVLFHNAKFDLDVIETHLGIAPPPWHRVHETTFLLYLDNPHRRVVDLKSAAKQDLGWEPEERDVVADWLVQHQPVAGVRISPKPQGKEPYGKYIAYAPPDIVGPYANGDVARTEALFSHIYASVRDRDMLGAYDRERKLVPILLDMERTGIRLDLERLRQDVTLYGSVLSRCDAWVRKRLKLGPEVNLNSDRQLLRALEDAELVDTSKMGLTPKGQVKMDKAAIGAGVADKQLAGVLTYAAQLKTCVNTFMAPWLAVAEKSGGLIFTNWNQIRGTDGAGGTRTGRFSSTPNFQNIPKEFAAIFSEELLAQAKTILDKLRARALRATAKLMPKMPFPLPPLPLCRGYIIPYKPGHTLISRDYSQQEPRILAHFEDGALQEQYQANPWIDYHDNAKFHLEQIFNRKFERKPVKNINLGIIYGQGVGSLAEKNGETVEATRKLRDAIYTLYPGLKAMNADMKTRAKANLPIRTWGGREYYCEPPRIADGRVQTFDYKMVNVLVQGSGADCTKEGILAFVSGAVEDDFLIEAGICALRQRDWFLLLQVHDELVISCPKEDRAAAQEFLRVAMESVKFDVQILTEGSWSNANWASMVDYDKKGKICGA